MNYKEKMLITGLIFGYLCAFLVIQDFRNDQNRNLGAGDGVYERKDDICS